MFREAEIAVAEHYRAEFALDDFRKYAGGLHGRSALRSEKRILFLLRAKPECY
jgi:hypothetical protein